MSADEPVAPAFTVTRGATSDEELAALTVVLTALRRSRALYAPSNGAVPAGWKSYWSILRQPFLPGRDAWRATVRQ